MFNLLRNGSINFIFQWVYVLYYLEILCGSLKTFWEEGEDFFHLLFSSSGWFIFYDL